MTNTTTDWRTVFMKYLEIVGDAEGVDFIDLRDGAKQYPVDFGDDWPEVEKAIMESRSRSMESLT